MRRKLTYKGGKTGNASVLAVFVFFVCGLIVGCGASSPYYKNGEERVEYPINNGRKAAPDFTLFLIGDTGSPSSDPLEPNLKILQHQLESAGNESAVVFLGDNIYSYGLLPENHSDRSESERYIDTQLKILNTYRGRTIFIPGNHDWNDGRKGGWEAIQRQQEYVENRLGPQAFIPDNGCPGPVEVRLDSTNVLLVMDTEWWLYPFAKPGPDECRAGSNPQFIAAVDSLVQHHKNRNLFVAGHHPLYSNGKHNGYFPVIDHLFPLLDSSPVLYIPLPIIGSVNPLYRKYVGYRQDLAGKQYRRLREKLTEIFRQHPYLVYASGHDHNLQYHPVENQHYIVSGGGTVQNYVRRGRSAAFAYSHKGFARLDMYADGVWLSFWTPGGDQPQGQMVYQRKLYSR